MHVRTHFPSFHANINRLTITWLIVLHHRGHVVACVIIICATLTIEGEGPGSVLGSRALIRRSQWESPISGDTTSGFQTCCWSWLLGRCEFGFSLLLFVPLCVGRFALGFDQRGPTRVRLKIRILDDLLVWLCLRLSDFEQEVKSCTQTLFLHAVAFCHLSAIS